MLRIGGPGLDARLERRMPADGREPRDQDQQQPDTEKHALEDRDADDRVARLIDRRLAGRPEEPQADGDQRDTDPLAPAELEAKETLGEHGQYDETAGDHGLSQRQRRERERTHVERPTHHRDRPADRPPLRSEELRRTLERPTHIDGWRGDRAAMLPQESEVGSQRGPNRKRQSDPQLAFHAPSPSLGGDACASRPLAVALPD